MYHDNYYLMFHNHILMVQVSMKITIH